MGLDVYLYHFLIDQAEVIRREREYWTGSEQIWGEVANGRSYDLLSEGEQNLIQSRENALATELGLNEEGEHPGKVEVEIDHPQYPDHIFKIGYWRSSYNESGINSLLRCNFNTDLYRLMGHESRESWQYPNWEECSTRVKQLLDSFRERRDNMYQVLSSQVYGEGPATQEEALRLFLDEKNNRSHHFDSYSSSLGEFWFGEPAHICAIMPSRSHGTWLIVKPETDWYVQALEIVKETCDYVLDQEDPEKYFLYWSG